MEGYGFLGEFNQRSGYHRIVWDKVSIKASESQECSYVFYCLRYRPICDSFDFGRVHSDGAVFQYDAKKFHCGLFKEAFLRFKE